MEIFVIYFIVIMVRAIVMALVFLYWNKVGLNFDWKKQIVAIWAGVRAPALIILGLMLQEYTTFDFLASDEKRFV